MKTLALTPDLTWVGALDPNLRVFDIIMETKYGSSYNAYLLRGTEKTALFETVKLPFWDGFRDALSTLIDPAKIDCLIVNHTEPDHAGSVENLLDLNPDLLIVGTAPALTFLKFIVRREFRSRVVKDGDTLSLGGKTLKFLSAPNLHWPDTMFTWVEEDGILFTCDAFGAHYAHEGILRSTVTDEAAYRDAFRYYYDCIMAPFARPFVQNAVRKVSSLPIRLVATGHGPVLDENIAEAIALYGQWSAEEVPFEKKTVVIPYVSAYGYTRELAEEIQMGILSAGDFSVLLRDMVEADREAVLSEIRRADGFLLGSPTIVGEALPPIWDLLSRMEASVYGKKWAGAFGSYGWSGEAVPHLTERLKQLNLKVVDGLKVRFKPSAEDRQAAFAFGKGFAERVLGLLTE